MQVERVLAPNPGPFTGPGTNTYLVSSAGRTLIIDPGPVIPAHLDEVVARVGGRSVQCILVTHTHPDHAFAANVLGDRLGVPVFGFGPGPGFAPTGTLADGDEIPLGGITLVAIHTPGHTVDHLCYLAGDDLFTGDHIIGGATVVMEDAAAYLASLRRVAAIHPARLHPGHGEDPMEPASEEIRRCIAHRLAREQEILAAVAGGAGTVGEVADRVYAGVPAVLGAAVITQVYVQLVKLSSEGTVSLAPGGVDRATKVNLSEERTT